MSWLSKRPKAQPIYRHPRVLLPSTVIRESGEYLRQSRGPDGPHEGVLYWAGISAADIWVVTTIILPSARTTRGSFRTTAKTNADVVGFLADHELVLLGQVHSHPGSFVDHSEGDIVGALMPYQSFLSVVVPNYACDGLLPLHGLGVHRFDQGEFQQLSEIEIKKTMVVVPSDQDFRR